jgi:cobalt-zinc-cadmium efflux system outer membrane protein
MRLFISIGLCLALAGCASHPSSFPVVARTVSDRTGYALNTNPDRSPQLDAAINDLLSKPLTADSAARLALLNSPALAAHLDAVRVAEAQLVIASQIKNPSFDIAVRPPDKPPSGTDIEASASADILDVLLVPLRKKIAQNQLDQATLQAADDALSLVHDVRVAVYACSASQQILQTQQQITAAAAAAADFSRRQHDAGNIDDLSWVGYQSAEAQSQLDLLRAETKLSADRESLNRLLGLNPQQMQWSISPALPPIPAQDSSQVAVNDRLDVQIATHQVALAEQSLSLTRNGLLTEVRLGASMERQSDSQTVAGPYLALDVPIFNQHQGEIAEAKAQALMAQSRLQELTINAQSDLRLANERLSAARSAADLANSTLLPLRKQAVELTQQKFNGMLVGLYTLLSARQDELSANRDAIETLRDYWIAKADLDRAVGH